MAIILKCLHLSVKQYTCEVRHYLAFLKSKYADMFGGNIIDVTSRAPCNALPEYKKCLKNSGRVKCVSHLGNSNRHE